MGHVGAGAAQDLQRFPVPGIVEDQEQATLTDGVVETLGAGGGIAQVAEVDAQMLAPGGLDAGHVGVATQAGPEHAVAKMVENGRMAGQGHGQRGLAHAGQAVGRERGRLAPAETVDKVSDQRFPTHKVWRQRRHIDVEWQGFATDEIYGDLSRPTKSPLVTVTLPSMITWLAFLPTSTLRT